MSIRNITSYSFVKGIRSDCLHYYHTFDTTTTRHFRYLTVCYIIKSLKENILPWLSSNKTKLLLWFQIDLEVLRPARSSRRNKDNMKIGIAIALMATVDVALAVVGNEGKICWLSVLSEYSGDKLIPPNLHTKIF